MRVDWRIVSNYLTGEVNAQSDYHALVFLNEDIWVCEIEKITDYGWALVNDKSDHSLIELMNWAEEELKFRESHEIYS